MQANKTYILSTQVNGKSMRPEANSLGAGLYLYDRPTDQAQLQNFLFLLESGGGSYFKIKHQATGHYLQSNDFGGSDIILAESSSSDNQKWRLDDTGADRARVTFVPSLSGDIKQFTVFADQTRVSLQGFNGNQNDAAYGVLFQEYNTNPSGVTAPLVAIPFEGANILFISGLAQSATVRVYINGSFVTSGIASGGAASIGVTMNIGDRVEVDQVANGVTSSKSTAVLVQSVGTIFGSDDYPRWRAHKFIVTSNPDGTVENLVGYIGSPLTVSYRATKAEARADLTAAGYTETTLQTSSSGTVTPPTTPCTETLPSATKAIFDSWVSSNLAAYDGRFSALIYRVGDLYYTENSTDTARANRLNIASLSKGFAGLVLMKLVDEGVFASGVNTTVGSVLSSFAGTSKENITLKQLMTMTSGLKAISDEGYENQSGLASCVACANLIAANVPLVNTIGTVFDYGGVHWAVAAAMAEQATGQRWIDICNTRIFVPLGLTKTSYNPDGFLAPTNPMIHAGVVTTIDEFMAIMRLRLKLGVWNGQRIISESNILAMETDQSGVGANYGYGLYVESGNNETFHHGATGWGCALNRNKKYALLISTIYYGGSNIDENDAFRGVVRSNLSAAPPCA